MTKAERLQYEAFRVIRSNISRYDADEMTNDEVAGFVKGVLRLESELYALLEREEIQSITNNLKEIKEVSETLNTPIITAVQKQEDETSLDKEEKKDADHNIPRNIPKDITEYYKNGSLYYRLHGINGYSKFEDIFVGDYFQMSTHITADTKCPDKKEVGSDYVTIAGISTVITVPFDHLVLIPGRGHGGIFHFGISRMNYERNVDNNYVQSLLDNEIIGCPIYNECDIEDGLSINEQLYKEFGPHLKSSRECIGGTHVDIQAVLMSEVEVFGRHKYGDTNTDYHNENQLPLFKDKRFIVNNRDECYWLRDQVDINDHCYCYCNTIITEPAYGKSYSYNYVRPRFIIS